MPFSPDGLDFLIENRVRNSKPWFEEHRGVFDTDVMAPLQQLVETLMPTMHNIDPEMVIEAKSGKSISRVRRDTRFTKDKSIYRSNMWCTFMRDKHRYEGVPAFYFDVSPDGFSYGCGWWRAGTRTMATMRRMIQEAHPQFQKAKKAYEGQTAFAMEGQSYVRSRFPDAPEALRIWLDRRGISFNHESEDFPTLFDMEKLIAQLKRDYPLLTEIYHFFLKVYEQKQLDYPTE